MKKFCSLFPKIFFMALISGLMLVSPGCGLFSSRNAEKSPAEEMGMTEAEYQAYMRARRQRRAIREAATSGVAPSSRSGSSSWNQFFSLERSSTEKRARLGNIKEPTLFDEPKNMIYPWKDEDRSQSDIIYDQRRENGK